MGIAISTLLKKSAIRFALAALRGLSILGKSVGLFFRFTFLKPASWILRWSFRFFVFPIYTRYTKIKQRIKFHPRMAGIRSIGHFTNRYALYLMLVTLGIFGIGSNLFARTIRPDEIGQRAVWTEFAQGDNALIVDASAGKPPSAAGVQVAAVGGAEVFSELPTIDILSPIETVPAIGGAGNEALTQRNPVESYTVQGGDTVSSIASSFSISTNTILWANGLGAGDFIKPGQVLKIPSVSGYLYTVKSGDSVAGLASKYKGKVDEILEANNLPLAEAIQVGQDLIIPGGEPPAPPAPTRTSIVASVPTTGYVPPSVGGNGAQFIWPTTSRRINQYYRGRFHTGIDIDGEYSSPVYASAAGRVTYAAASRNGYGIHVIIDHGNGYTTLYAHLSKLFVGAGQRVGQGQTLGMQGCTGRCTGVHLHFEIRLRGSFLNPLSFY